MVVGLFTGWLLGCLPGGCWVVYRVVVGLFTGWLLGCLPGGCWVVYRLVVGLFTGWLLGCLPGGCWVVYRLGVGLFTQWLLFVRFVPGILLVTRLSWVVQRLQKVQKTHITLDDKQAGSILRTWGEKVGRYLSQTGTVSEQLASVTVDMRPTWSCSLRGAKKETYPRSSLTGRSNLVCR